jgi:hypothetical protein
LAQNALVGRFPSILGEHFETLHSVPIAGDVDQHLGALMELLAFQSVFTPAYVPAARGLPRPIASKHCCYDFVRARRTRLCIQVSDECACVDCYRNWDQMEFHGQNSNTSFPTYSLQAWSRKNHTWS